MGVYKNSKCAPGRTRRLDVRKGTTVQWGPGAPGVDSGAVIDPWLPLEWTDVTGGFEWGGMCRFSYPGPSCFVNGADMVAGAGAQCEGQSGGRRELG